MKCRLCGIEKDTRRQMQGHLMFSHKEDYKRAEFNMDRLVEGAPPRVKEAKKAQYERKQKQLEKPQGFRLLKREDPTELNAINAGFLYTDGDNVFTADDAKAEGWI